MFHSWHRKIIDVQDFYREIAFRKNIGSYRLTKNYCRNYGWSWNYHTYTPLREYRLEIVFGKIYAILPPHEKLLLNSWREKLLGKLNISTDDLLRKSIIIIFSKITIRKFFKCRKDKRNYALLTLKI
jgi:hypothetical protein